MTPRRKRYFTSAFLASTALFGLLSQAAAQQPQRTPKPLGHIDASFSLPKQQYFAGEPIELEFVAKNPGPGTVEMTYGGIYGQCGAYRIHFLSDPQAPSAPWPKTGPCSHVLLLEQLNCLSGSQSIPSGGSLKQHILINRYRDLSRPGIYQFEAIRNLANPANWGLTNQPARKVSARFTITIQALSSQDVLKAAFSPYLTNLSSGDEQRKREAAIAISTVPAPFLEPELVQMLSSPQLRSLAIEGLRKLNTPGSRNALYAFLKNEKPFSPKWLAALQARSAAIEALSTMGDPQFGRLLLHLMKRDSNPEDQGLLLEAAARLSRASVLPAIQPYLNSPNPDQRYYGVQALAATELPSALPLLVNLLNDSSFRVRSTAAKSLVSLTSESPSKDGLYWSGEDPADDASFWSSWLGNHPTHPIHPLRNCPQFAGSSNASALPPG